VRDVHVSRFRTATVVVEDAIADDVLCLERTCRRLTGAASSCTASLVATTSGSVIVVVVRSSTPSSCMSSTMSSWQSDVSESIVNVFSGSRRCSCSHDVILVLYSDVVVTSHSDARRWIDAEDDDDNEWDWLVLTCPRDTWTWTHIINVPENNYKNTE